MMTASYQDSLWFKRKRKLLEDHAGLVVFSSVERYGAAFFIHELDGEGMPLVWLELTQQDEHDPVAQGNRLVDAVKRRLSDLVLPLGMPFAYGVNMLKSHLGFMGPLTIAASNMHFAPEFAEDLLDFARTGNWVVLSFDALPEAFELPDQALLISQGDLALTLEEALHFVDGRLPEAKVVALVEATEGAFLDFMTELELLLERSGFLVPSAMGPRVLEGGAIEFESAALVRRFVKKRRFQEATELAVASAPEVLPEFIEEAGHDFHQRGMHKRLFVLLSQLPEFLYEHEFIRFWQLIAAFRVAKQVDFFESTEAYLERHEAPHLRAAFAGIFVQKERSLQEAKRAFDAHASAYTGFQYARLMTDVQASLAIHMRALEAAERSERPYEIARASGEIAKRMLEQGDYKAALTWAEWGLKHFDEAGFSDYPRRLNTINYWVYAKLLCDDTAALGLVLEENAVHLTDVYPALALRFRSSFADYLLVKQKPSEALLLYRECLAQASRDQMGFYGLYLIRCLLELKEFEAAVAESERLLVLTKEAHPYSLHTAILAQGMVLCFTEPKLAVAPLEKSLQFFGEPRLAYLLAQAALYLAKAHYELGQVERARRILQKAKPSLAKLNKRGLHLLGGAEADFKDVFALLKGQSVPLELKFLGRKEVWLNNQLVPLSQRQVEVLAVLAIKQRPITLDELSNAFDGTLK